MAACTRVRVSFFKPAGYEDTFYVATQDRGAAVRAVLDRAREAEMPFLNYVGASACAAPEGADLIEVLP